MKERGKGHLDRVSKRESYSQRQTLRHRYHQHRHANDDELDVVGEIVHVPGLIISVELVHRELDGEDEDCDEADSHASVTNLDGKVGELGLKDALLLLLHAGRAVCGGGLQPRLAWSGVWQTVVGQSISHAFLYIN